MSWFSGTKEKMGTWIRYTTRTDRGSPKEKLKFVDTNGKILKDIDYPKDDRYMLLSPDKIKIPGYPPVPSLPPESEEVIASRRAANQAAREKIKKNDNEFEMKERTAANHAKSVYENIVEIIEGVNDERAREILKYRLHAYTRNRGSGGSRSRKNARSTKKAKRS